ncbi:MAG: dTDP-4-dehydrorhamnose reductase, partial [Chloroflexia bacterium]|nr:dTDP-4-dehydrorhamnose reductase [Chloroflexia bacterium]
AEVIGTGSKAGDGIDIVADLTDAEAVRRAIDHAAPEIVIHAAAFTDVDGAEREPERAHAVNAAGSRCLAEAARDAGAYLIAVGTDFVFAGDGDAPYAEDATPRPLSVYGASKLAGERAILETDPGFAVARTAWLYGGAGKHFPRTVLGVVRDRGGIAVVADEIGSPTFAGDLAVALVDLAGKQGSGVFHLVNEGRASRFAFAQAVAAAGGLDPSRVTATTTAEFLAKYPLPARRPVDSTLVNRRGRALGIVLRPWREAVDGYVPRLATEMRQSAHQS